MSYTLPVFLAHAIALEHEAAERYLELADMMEAHRNDEVSALFRDMHRFSLMHRDAIADRVGTVELPQLRSWEYRWRTPPEMGDDDAFDYMLDAYHALSYARENEARAMQYYRSVAQETSEAEVERRESAKARPKVWYTARFASPITVFAGLLCPFKTRRPWRAPPTGRP